MFTMTRAAVSLVLLMILGAGSAITPAQAHNTTGCSGKNSRWPGTSATYAYPTSWSFNYRNGITTAASRINGADFTWTYNSGSGNVWGNWGSNDVFIAGYAQTWWNCGATYAEIYRALMYYNFPHWQASPHVADQYTCTAIHEFGHGLGLAHNSVTSVLNTDHDVQCHINQWSSRQAHDTSDINALY